MRYRDGRSRRLSQGFDNSDLRPVELIKYSQPALAERSQDVNGEYVSGLIFVGERKKAKAAFDCDHRLLFQKRRLAHSAPPVSLGKSATFKLNRFKTKAPDGSFTSTPTESTLPPYPVSIA